MKEWKCEKCKCYYLHGNKGKLYPAESEQFVDHKCIYKNDWFINCMENGVVPNYPSWPDFCDTFKPCSIFEIMKVQMIKNGRVENK